MKYSLLLAALLAGCACQPKTVEVPVPVTCKVDMPQPPIEYFSKLNKDEPLLVKANALIAENKERKAYELKLEALLIKCTN